MKTVLITGGTAGIGLAATKLFLQNGWQVMMAGDYAMTAYNATKGAIINMTRAMAMDYGPLGIRVNSVSPGPTNTAMFHQTMKERFSQNSPLQRIVEPSEVAAAIYFMSTEASSAITGENIPVTAGFEIGTGQPKQA
ncbi:SDR family oxidoreductase [Limosilactobacillus mucosae]|uniref:SDR family oxidoreductase n=1 Tax=Limosilactobacillus mucosae TaxID=97478 RepID=UPI003B43B2A0